MDESFASDSSVGQHAQKGITRDDLLAELRRTVESSHDPVPARPREEVVVEKPEQAVKELSSFAIIDDTMSELR